MHNVRIALAATNIWTQYNLDKTYQTNTTLSNYTVLLNHEIGHCLGLHHTMRDDYISTVCLDSYNDYCSDTPTKKKLLTLMVLILVVAV